MTKEKLEKEAEEKFKVNNKDKGREHYYDRMWFKTGYLAGAEPREKRIEELEKENERLKGDLELWESGGCRATNIFECGVVKELKEQIEKMKRHCNCKHRDSEGYCEVKRTYLIDLSYDGCDKWELED